MYTLTINDIKNWLIENRDEYQKLKAQEFPPFDNPLFSMYGHLKDFIQYYKFKNICEGSLVKLKSILNLDFNELAEWVKENEVLGSQDLLMFEINYIKWNEQVDEEQIKIHEGLYTDRRPFANIICFCQVFQHLYWDNCIHENGHTISEQLEVKSELISLIRNYFSDV